MPGKTFVCQGRIELQSHGRIAAVYIDDIIVRIVQGSRQVKSRCTVRFQTGNNILDSKGGSGITDRKVIYHA